VRSTIKRRAGTIGNRAAGRKRRAFNRIDRDSQSLMKTMPSRPTVSATKVGCAAAGLARLPCGASVNDEQRGAVRRSQRGDDLIRQGDRQPRSRAATNTHKKLER